MSQGASTIGDMPQGGWVDRWLPAAWRPFARLMRLDRPIGTWLLLFPGWWALGLAGGGAPDIALLALFGLGAIIMRGAGCTVNDIVDRDLDAQVARTAGRPLASGAVTLGQAMTFLVAKLAAGLAILLQFNAFAIAVGAASLLLVFPYPLMKRVTYWPQAWLGLTFNWGALLGWAAATGELSLAALLLYAGGVFWTLGYDTIYAHQDKTDDAVIGIKSSALALGPRTRPALVAFYALAVTLIAAAGAAAAMGPGFWGVLALASLQPVWQVATLDEDDPDNCLNRFKSNRWFGFLVFLAILAGAPGA